MAYGDFKDVNRRTFAYKVLRDKALILLKIENMMDISRDVFQSFINFLIKKPLVVVWKIKIFLIKD